MQSNRINSEKKKIYRNRTSLRYMKDKIKAIKYVWFLVTYFNIYGNN